MRIRPTKLNAALLLAMAFAGFSSGARAAGTEAASAQISATSLGGGLFDYTILLKNVGTTNLETFWYSWIPGQDYMPVSPTNIISPANWVAAITHAGAGDGFAIQWQTASSSTPNPLLSGGSLSFSFDSTATPATMAGNSPFFTSTPIGTSFVYIGGPLTDAGFEFDVASAPEPSSVVLVGMGAMAIGCLAWRRRPGQRN